MVVEKNESKLKRVLTYGLFLGLLILSIVLLLLPKDYFDSGQSVCLSVVLFNLECYGCGMTRAIQHLIHFDFSAAYAFNKLSFIVFPLLVGMIVYEFVKFIRSEKL